MALPININELINGRTVEWERLEFKRGWNPLEAAQSLAAFANDINNWGGGYIIIGVDERDGHPVLPPVGIPTYEIDRIQKSMVDIA
jgi:ATP-dependent DNA helicase RecG